MKDQKSAFQNPRKWRPLSLEEDRFEARRPKKNLLNQPSTRVDH